MISIRIYCQYSLLKSRSKLFPTKSNSLVLAPFHLKKRQTTKKKIQRKKRNLAPKLPFLFPPKKRKKEAFRSFFLSFFLLGCHHLLSSSLIIIAREGKTNGGKAHHRAMEKRTILKSGRFENFFFARFKTLSRDTKREFWNALSIVSRHRRQNEWIDEASCFLIIIIIIQTRARKIYIKRTTTNNRTYHTPTQEYVVPKSIPIAGPSDLDIFV